MHLVTGDRSATDVRLYPDWSMMSSGRTSCTRGTDPRHARRMLLQVTPLGFEVLRQGEAIFDELRDQWERQIGPAQLEALRRTWQRWPATAVRFDTPGWMSRDLGEPA